MIRTLALLFTLAAAPVFATQDGWPALHDVTGVADNDVLNIRAAPDTSSEIIGTLAPDARNIEVIEPTDDLTWGRIATGEGMGWVSLAYLMRQPGQWDGRFPDITICTGTEPFWSLTRKDTVYAFDRLDQPPISASVEWETGALNHRGRLSFRAGDLVGVLSNEICNDGMSELEYGWELNLIELGEGAHYQGCCSIRPRAE